MAHNAKPKILYDNLLEGASLTATDPDSETQYDVDNIVDLRPYTLHRFGAAGTKYITADYGEAVSADALGIVGHNLGTAEATVSVESSANNSDWTERLAGFQPANDTALMKEFTSASARYWRIKIVTASVTVQIGVALLGEVLTFERWPRSGLDPDALKIKASSQTSKTGNMLGATLGYVSREFSLKFQNLTPSWVSNTFVPAWDAHLELLKPFLLAWDITNHATEVYFVRLPDNATRAMPYDPVRRSLSLKLVGVKE